MPHARHDAMIFLALFLFLCCCLSWCCGCLPEERMPPCGAPPAVPLFAILPSLSVCF